MPTSLVADGVLAGALAIHAELLARLRRVDAPTPPWWFGYARDGTNLSAAAHRLGRLSRVRLRAGGRLPGGRADHARPPTSSTGSSRVGSSCAHARARARGDARRLAGVRGAAAGRRRPRARAAHRRRSAGLIARRPCRRSARPASRRAARSARARSPARCPRRRRFGPAPSTSLPCLRTYQPSARTAHADGERPAIAHRQLDGRALAAAALPRRHADHLVEQAGGDAAVHRLGEAAVRVAGREAHDDLVAVALGRAVEAAGIVGAADEAGARAKDRFTHWFDH